MGAVQVDPVEIDAATLAANLDDPMWRVCNLYKIIVKGDDEGDEEDSGLVIQFKPNRAQRRLMARLWHRNIILKARQLGFTTLICILWLDTALFAKSPMQLGIIAQDKGAAEKIFRTKIKFAYDNLPESLKAEFPLLKCTTSEIEFAHNNSNIKVATSVRSGTIHRLHISEYGKICKQYPHKAKEVVTGSIPAVPANGILVIESTAEGQDGDFYKKTMRAKALDEQIAANADITLTKKDYRFHFFAWWEAPEYTLDPDGIVLTEADNKYFHHVEGKIKRKLTDGQKAWYVTTLRSDFNGEAPLMWQEYPSFPEEAFQVSTDGCYYANQMADARKTGRIVPVIPAESVPVNTFWDLGRGDMTSIWFHQRIAMENRFIRYYEESGEDLDHFADYLQKTGYVFGTHFLPHDANYRRLGMNRDTNFTLKEILERLLPGHRFEVIPVVSNINAGIQATRSAFGTCLFSEEGCSVGLARLGNYRKMWDKNRGCWRDEPLHDINSHGADAFRQFGQEFQSGNQFLTAGNVNVPNQVRPLRRRRSGMAV